MDNRCSSLIANARLTGPVPLFYLVSKLFPVTVPLTMLEIRGSDS